MNREDPAPRPAATEAIEEARAQAVAGQKKLLFFVFPEPDFWQRTHEIGFALGEYLNHGSSTDLAPLSAVVVACARMADLAAVFGAVPGGEPLLVLVDPAASPAGLRGLGGPLPPSPEGQLEGGSLPEDEEAAISARIATLAGLVREALGAIPASEVEARAGQVRREIVAKRPTGAQWATSYGCGNRYEEGPELTEGVMCGMGYIPERSARFLHFLAGRSLERWGGLPAPDGSPGQGKPAGSEPASSPRGAQAICGESRPFAHPAAPHSLRLARA